MFTAFNNTEFQVISTTFDSDNPNDPFRCVLEWSSVALLRQALLLEGRITGTNDLDTEDPPIGARMPVVFDVGSDRYYGFIVLHDQNWTVPIRQCEVLIYPAQTDYAGGAITNGTTARVQLHATVLRDLNYNSPTFEYVDLDEGDPIHVVRHNAHYVLDGPNTVQTFYLDTSYTQPGFTFYVSIKGDTEGILVEDVIGQPVSFRVFGDGVTQTSGNLMFEGLAKVVFDPNDGLIIVYPDTGIVHETS